MKKGECAKVGCYDAISWDAGCLTGLQYHHRVFHKLQVIIIIARVSSFFYSSWETWIQWVLLITQFKIFWCPKPVFKFRSAAKFHCCGEVCKTDILLRESRPFSKHSFIQAGKHDFNEFCWSVSDILMTETRIQIQKCCKVPLWEVCKTDIFQSLHLELGRSKLGAKQHCYKYFGTNRNLFSIYFNMHEIHSEIYLSHLMVLPFTNTWNKKCFIIFRCTSISSTYPGE